MDDPSTGVKRGPVEIADYTAKFNPYENESDRRILYEITKRRTRNDDSFISDTDSGCDSDGSKPEDG